MRRGLAFSTIVLCAVAMAGDAQAKLDLYIDKSTQQMSVIRNGALLYAWPVSTGLDRFSTPSGIYTPERLEPIWYSKAYNAPMPHAIFFHHGYAIHGSYDITQLGGPASHGCIRLHPQEAALLFAMVEQEGPGNTTIVIGGGPTAAVPPRHRDLDAPPRPSYVRDNAIAPGAYPPNPAMSPYGEPYRYVDGPERGRGDDGRSAMREAYPNRPPLPRLEAQVPMEPPRGPDGRYLPPPPRLDAQVPMEPPRGPGGRYQPPPPRLDAQVPMEPPRGAGGRYQPPPPRLDAQVPMEPPRGPGGRYQPPPPRLDAQVPMEPPRGPGGRYQPPPPRLDAQVPMEPPRGAGGRYQPPPPRLDAQVPMEPPRGPGGRYLPPPPRLDAQVPMEPTLPPPRGYGPPASRFDAQTPIEPTVPPRGRYRPPAPVQVSAKSTSANRSASAIPPAKSPPPSPLSESTLLPSAPSGSAQPPWPPSASSPPASPQSPWPLSASTQPTSSPPASPSPPTASQSSEPHQSGSRYKVLPRSYWAGASWRWRLKVEHEISAPSLTSNSQ
jgi:hypothetical protein